MQRRIDIKITIDRWNFVSGTMVPPVLDVTNSATSYTWHKTIKTPISQVTIKLTPQHNQPAILDTVHTMDVVKIREFGILKFIGYIRQISTDGSITQSGEPRRSTTIVATHFGGIYAERSLGLNLGAALKKVDLMGQAASDFYTAMTAKVSLGVTHGIILQELITQWSSVVNAVGAGAFLKYAATYTDYTLATNFAEASSVPKQLDIFNGSEEDFSLWTVAQQLMEAPLNELWFDNGPRTINVNAVPLQLPPTGKVYLVLRPTPFDGTTVTGRNPLAFSSIVPIVIPRDYLVSYNFTRHIEEAYSLFFAIPAAFDYGTFARMLLGEVAYDQSLITKYLYKPIQTQLFFTRMESDVSTIPDPKKVQIGLRAVQVGTTLLNWFKNNDQYLSGVIRIMTPNGFPVVDPRIGDRLTLEGLTGSFYVEAVSHSWNYGSALLSDLTVTRGYNYLDSSPIKLVDRVFRQGKAPGALPGSALEALL